MTSEDPAMELARRGAKGKVDTFLGFWLEILIDGRQAKFELTRGRTQRTIERFLARSELVSARRVLGDDAVAHELRDAAALYFRTCRTDVAYTSTLFRTKRVPEDQVVLKAAQETASAVGVLMEARVADPLAQQLPDLLIGGFVTEIGALGVLRRALLGNPASAVVAGLLDED